MIKSRAWQLRCNFFISPLHVGHVSSLHRQQVLFLLQRKRLRRVPVFCHPVHDFASRPSENFCGTFDSDHWIYRTRLHHNYHVHNRATRFRWWTESILKNNTHNSNNNPDINRRIFRFVSLKSRVQTVRLLLIRISSVREATDLDVLRTAFTFKICFIFQKTIRSDRVFEGKLAVDPLKIIYE